MWWYAETAPVSAQEIGMAAGVNLFSRALIDYENAISLQVNIVKIVKAKTVTYTIACKV